MAPRGFGAAKDGTACHLYTLENDHFIVTMTDYGATLVSLYFKDQKTDVVLGFDDVRGYVEQVPYMGATVGRVCNRIAAGRFSLAGHQYQLPLNNHGNTLHGGTIGFSARVWEVAAFQDNLIPIYLVSPDGDQGFPGRAAVWATYALRPDGLEFTYRASSDADTLLALTNHSYFNLCGPSSGSVLDHVVMTPADRIVAVDANGLATADIIETAGTPFDFSTPKAIGRDIMASDPQLANGHGYDHHFMVPGQGLRPHVACQANGIRLEISSDLPGFQMYTGNFLKGDCDGKQGGDFPYRSAVCFETQFCPNTVNTGIDAVPLLKAGTGCEHRTIYRIGAI